MRKLRIGTDTIRFVAGYKDRIDALAFAILIKQKRINSTITNATQRKLKEVFGMGSDKLKRVIDDGIELGFLRREGGNIIANKLHSGNGLSLMMKSNWFVSAKNKNKKKKLKLAGVRSMIEVLIVTNQVSMQNSCRDTHNSATDGKDVREIRSARKRERRMLKRNYNAKFTGLSNIRIQQLIGRKHNKAVKIVKTAIAKGLLKKQVREKVFDLVGVSLDTLSKAMLRDNNIVVWAQNHSGSLRFSNEYLYVGKIINKANHGK